jgi:hypothetical protein
MKEKSLIVLFFFAWIFITNIHAQIDYPAQSSEFYQPAMSSDMPMQQSSFQSSSYYNNTYTVPFAAENINVSNNDPYASSSSTTPSGRRNAGAPDVTGPPPPLPSFPLGDGMWFLLFCAVGAVLRITFKRTEKANIQ